MLVQQWSIRLLCRFEDGLDLGEGFAELRARYQRLQGAERAQAEADFLSAAGEAVKQT